MPRIYPINRYPKIKQIHNDWCMFASIENSIKFFDQNACINQNDFVLEYQRIFMNRQPHFELLRQTLESSYPNINLDYNVESWHDYLSMMQYIESMIQNNYPVIVSMRLPGRVHIWNVISFDDQNVNYFDTDRNISNQFIPITRTEFERYFQLGRQTFLVHP